MAVPSANGTAKHEDALNMLSSLNQKADALRAGDEKARDAMVAECLALAAKLETPSETFMRTMWSHTMQPSVLKVASDMKLFQALAKDGTPKTVDQLATATGSDRVLTRMVLQNLAAMYFIAETDVETFAPTTLSNHMTEQTWADALSLFVPFSINTAVKVPEYLKEIGYRMPPNGLDTPVQYVYGGRGQLHMQAIMHRDGHMPGLAGLLKLWLDNRPHWSDEKAGFYPVRERLIEGAETSPDSTFLVDVGGNKGHDFDRLFTHIDPAEIPGRMVLQDQPHVVESIPKGSFSGKVEVTAHDFFTPQPVQGARVYLMHNILHNFPDSNARTILKQTASAMKKGYSKLLLWDTVLPDKGAGANECCLDWLMMTFYGSSERTESQWRKLVEDPEIGLKVKDIVKYSQYDQDVIELELA